MTIKINWATVVGVAAVALTACALYKVVKDSKDEREEFEAHKKEEIGDRDITDEINQASHFNEKFEAAETKAAAFQVLEDLSNKVDAAKTIADFDTAFKKYNEAYTLLMYQDKEQANSMLIVYKDRLDEERRRRKEASTRAYERSKETERNRAEVKKAEIISNAIKNASKIAFSTNEWSKKNAIKNAVNELADLTVTINKSR